MGLYRNIAGAAPITTTTDTLTDEYTKLAEQVRLSNEQRSKAIEGIFDAIIARYGPGGEFGKSYEQELQAQKTRDIGKVSQSDISRGLYGIRPYGQEWEATVGAPARLKLEDIRFERLASAQQNKASFLERIEEPYPDYNTLLQASAAKASTPTVTYGGSGGSFFSRNLLAEGGFGNWNNTGTTVSPSTGNYSSQMNTQNTYQQTPNPATMYDETLQRKIYSDLLAGEAAAQKTTQSVSSLTFEEWLKTDRMTPPPSVPSGMKVDQNANGKYVVWVDS